MRYSFLLVSFFVVNTISAQSPKSLADSAFYMPVEDVFPVQGKGLAIVGKISTGKIAVGQKVQLKGFSENPLLLTVNTIEKGGQVQSTVQAGDIVGLLFTNGVTKDQVERGMAITDTGFAMLDTVCEADLKLLNNAPSLKNNDRVAFFYNNVHVVTNAILIMPPGKILSKGQKMRVRIRFPRHLVLIPGMKFALCTEGSYNTYANGVFVIKDK